MGSEAGKTVVTAVIITTAAETELKPGLGCHRLSSLGCYTAKERQLSAPSSNTQSSRGTINPAEGTVRTAAAVPAAMTAAAMQKVTCRHLCSSTTAHTGPETAWKAPHPQGPIQQQQDATGAHLLPPLLLLLPLLCSSLCHGRRERTGRCTSSTAVHRLNAHLVAATRPTLLTASIRLTV